MLTPHTLTLSDTGAGTGHNQPGLRSFSLRSWLTIGLSCVWLLLLTGFMLPLSATPGLAKLAATPLSDNILANNSAFQDKSVARNAAMFRDRLAALYKPRRLPAKAWMLVGNKALDLNRLRLAAKAFVRAALADPANAAAWLKLSAVLAALPPEIELKTLKTKGEEWIKADNSGLAAWLAYRATAASSEDKADALALLGKALEKAQKWRPALEAYKASLAYRNDKAIRRLYTDLDGRKGFRLLDHKINSDSATPRVCLTFSEKLPEDDLSLTNYVRVDGARAAAVTVSDKQLCIDGFKHGQRQEVVVRPGLPSAKYGPLTRQVRLKFYVKDRTASIRFAGRQYVLPKTGQAGIPLTTVNVSSAKINIYRIGDRNLTDTVLDSDFGDQISEWAAEKIRDRTGEILWTGSLKIAKKLNEEVVTAFPVSDVIRTFKPGVYVMTAQTSDVKGESWYPLATQWFIVSDLGLTAYNAADGLHIFVRSLTTATGLKQAKVRLVARNNEVLGTRQTDSTGYLRFSPGLARGTGGLAPAMIVATTDDGDYAFLSLKGPAFDLSDRGVTGKKAAGPVNVFLYTERGIYRPGADVHISALIRDAEALAITDVPLTLVITRPDGVEHSRIVARDQGLGGRTNVLHLQKSVMTGTWQIAAYTDPKQAPLAVKKFLVEDFVPDRLTMTLTTKTKRVMPGTRPVIDLDGAFLYGAVASNLRLEGSVVIKLAKTVPDSFKGYRFGDDKEEVTPVREDLDKLGRTDAKGKAQLAVPLPERPDTTRPLAATITVRMLEPSNRGIERQITVPLASARPLIGIKPNFADDRIKEGQTAGFDIAVMGPDGKQQAFEGLRWELSRIERQYQWYQSEGRWTYETIEHTKRIAHGQIDALADKPVRVASPVKWGRYKLDVFTDDAKGPSASYHFYAGWYSVSSAADTPDILDVALNKASYKAGETAELKVQTRYGGRLLVTILNHGLVHRMETDIMPGGASVPLPVDATWGPGAYVVATLYRPMNVTAKRMPTRAIGVSWMSVDRDARTLKLALAAPEKIRPQGKLVVPVKIDGLKPGERAYVMAAAVDVGILNLTRYTPPKPDSYFYGQYRMATEIRDLYGRLIDGMTGVKGIVRSGGDEGGKMAGPPPVEKPLSLFTGMVKVAEDGTAKLEFNIPAFTGTVRVMAVAWSERKIGHGFTDVFVRDPIVITGTTPRFLAMGDLSRLHLEFDNVEAPAGTYKLTVESEGLLSEPAAPQSFDLVLAAKQRLAKSIPLKAAGIGTAIITARLESADGSLKLSRSFEIPVKPQYPAITMTRERILSSNQSLLLTSDVLSDFAPGTGKASFSSGPRLMSYVPALLTGLNDYPWRCSEQITSRSLPFLYLSSIAKRIGLKGGKGEQTIKARINKAITRLLSRQGSDGSFGLWSPGGNDLWLNAYVSDFLTRARDLGFDVPETGYETAMDYLANRVGYAEDFKKGGDAIAYALYVLARNKRARIGDLRYYVDQKLEAFTAPLAKAQLGAAMQFYGDKLRAGQAFAAAIDVLKQNQQQKQRRYNYATYGSNLRDGAAVLTLISESGSRISGLATLEQLVEQQSHVRDTSTQEKAWLLLAANGFTELAKNDRLAVNGQTHKGLFMQSWSGAALKSQPVKISNLTDRPVRTVMTLTGVPLVAEPAVSKGFTLVRSYFTLDGQKVQDLSKVKQNTRLMVVLRALQIKKAAGRVLVVDYLPAGFEIENPRLIDSAQSDNFPWLPSGLKPTHAEFRSDRFAAAYTLNGTERNYMVMSYMVRAITPGSYTLPPATVEDMYRPEFYARTRAGKLAISADQPE